MSNLIYSLNPNDKSILKPVQVNLHISTGYKSEIKIYGLFKMHLEPFIGSLLMKISEKLS